MREMRTELWDHYMVDGSLICITTNGFVKMNGKAVCGRGCALEATRVIPDFSAMLGRYIRTNGNVPGFLQTDPAEWGVLIFPVKHNWWEKASMNLILAGAHFLFEQAVQNPSMTYYLPRPGCGNGQLKWDDVKELIEFLPDNVIAVTK